MTELIICPACNYTRQPTDYAADWECPNCHKAYFKTERIEQQPVSEEQSKIGNPSGPSAASFIMLILIVASLFTLGMLIYAGRPWHMKLSEIISWTAIMLGFGTWNITPYLILGYNARKLDSTARQSLTLLVGTIMVAAFGAYCLIDTMFVHPDAQGALIFIFLPAWQMIGVGATVGIAASKWAKDVH